MAQSSKISINIAYFLPNTVVTIISISIGSEIGLLLNKIHSESIPINYIVLSLLMAFIGGTFLSIFASQLSSIQQINYNTLNIENNQNTFWERFYKVFYNKNRKTLFGKLFFTLLLVFGLLFLSLSLYLILNRNYSNFSIHNKFILRNHPHGIRYNNSATHLKIADKERKICNPILLRTESKYTSLGPHSYYIPSYPIRNGDTLKWDIKIPNNTERKSIYHILFNNKQNNRCVINTKIITEDTKPPEIHFNTENEKLLQWTCNEEGNLKGFHINVLKNDLKIIDTTIMNSSFFNLSSFKKGEYTFRFKIIDKFDNVTRKDTLIVIK